MTIESQSSNAFHGYNPFGLAEQGDFPLGRPVDLHHAMMEVRQLKEFRPPAPDPLAELFKQPLFRHLGKEMRKSLEHLGESIGRFLSHVHLPGVAHLPENIRDLFSGFVGFILVLLGLYAFYLILGWLLRWTERRQPKLGVETRVFEGDVLMNSTYHVKKAKSCAGQGAYDEGIRHFYLAALCLLDETAVAPYSVNRTNLEYQEQIAEKTGKTPLNRPFGQLARLFEGMRYGRQSMALPQFTACEKSYQDLQEATAAYG